jgi:small subunit ribosomal protein S8e
MQQYHKPHGKKVSSGSGGRTRKFKDKKLSHVGGVFSSTKVSTSQVTSKVRTRGGSLKTKVKKAAHVNVVTKSGTKVAKILRVLESHNSEYVRMNILVKGTIIETDLGKVKVTNRVGQDGVVNGVLVS